MVNWEDTSVPEPMSFANVERVDAECVGLLLKHTHEVIDLTFSPDGKFLASVAQDGKILIWELEFSDQEDPKTGEVTTAVVLPMRHLLRRWKPMASHRLLGHAGNQDAPNTPVYRWRPDLHGVVAGQSRTSQRRW
jgi:WD40 repeat protein